MMEASNSKKRPSASLTSSLFGDAPETSSELFSSKSTAILDEQIHREKRPTTQVPTSANDDDDEQEEQQTKENIMSNRKLLSERDELIDMLELKREPEVDDQVFAEDICSTLKASGVALVRKFVNPGALQGIMDIALEHRSRICDQLKKRGHSSTNSTTTGGTNCCNAVRYWEVAIRCQGRMDARYPADAPDELWESHSVLQRTINHLLDGGGTAEELRPRLVYAGFIFSEPGSVDQPWHQDGIPLFPGSTADTLPPYAVNVFIPLESADLETGPTEFLVGSHRLLGTTNPPAGSNDDERIVTLLPEKGDILLYDYRVCHRGTSNLSSDRLRTVLYLMYARPWFKEHLNFGSDHLLS